MSTRKIKDAKDLSTNELIYFKGHAQATYMSDGTTVEDAINNIEVTGGIGDLSNIEDSILNLINNKLDNISDLEVIRNGAAKGATALQALDLNNYALSVSGQINNINSSMNSVSSEVSNIKRIAEEARTKAANNESAISQCATKHELNTAVANLVDSAPETLNTLNELATAITEHQNVTDALDAAITNKADKTEIPTKISLLENDVPYAIDYAVKNGLYIYDIDGRFTLPDNWDTANNSKAVGVAILTDDCKFVVAKEDLASSYVYWGSFGIDTSTLTNYTDAALAATDFDGVNNTSKIISAIGNTNDGYRDGTAAGDCAAYTFPNGKTGYLGAAGEWQVARQNKEDLNSALTLIGGTTMEESTYWTSTEYSSFDAWIQWFSSRSDLHDSSKARSGRYGRAFLALERPKPLKERVSDLESNKQDKLVSGTNIKTINGESILGSGDIVISGGGGSSSGGSGAYDEVNHGTSDTTFTLTPNTFHVWDEVASLDLSFADEQAGVANEFLFQFTSGATATTLTLPDGLKWANDNAPTIAENMIYQVSVLKGLASVLEFSNAASTIFFYIDQIEYQADRGSTWETWIGSEYNTDGWQQYEGMVIDASYQKLLSVNRVPVALNDEIIEGYNYETMI